MAALDTHAIARTLTDANHAQGRRGHRRPTAEPEVREGTWQRTRTTRGKEVIRVNTRDEFDDALEELFETGRPIEAPSVDLEVGGVLRGEAA